MREIPTPGKAELSETPKQFLQMQEPCPKAPSGQQSLRQNHITSPFPCSPSPPVSALAEKQFIERSLTLSPPQFPLKGIKTLRVWAGQSPEPGAAGQKVQKVPLAFTWQPPGSCPSAGDNDSRARCPVPHSKALLLKWELVWTREEKPFVSQSSPRWTGPDSVTSRVPGGSTRCLLGLPGDGTAWLSPPCHSLCSCWVRRIK